MSHPELVYPASRYDGEPGLVNARFRPADHEPEVRNRAGGSVHYLATGAGTDGEFGLYRWEMAAGQTGPDAHFHRTISESFYVLSGTIRLSDGRSWLDGRPGDFLFVPEGGLHGFRNESGAPASMNAARSSAVIGSPRASVSKYSSRGAPGANRISMLRHDTYWR
jgi:quercetin dioxygenase-like cupin family protein